MIHNPTDACLPRPTLDASVLIISQGRERAAPVAAEVNQSGW